MDQIHKGIEPRQTLVGVGSRHPLFSNPPQSGGMIAFYAESGITLHVIDLALTDKDVDVFNTGGLSFGLLPFFPGYVWLLNTGFAAFDAPYAPGLEPPERQQLPGWQNPKTDQTRFAIQVVLIDRLGIVRALKFASVSPWFSRKLEQVHSEALKNKAINRSSWDAVISGYESKYPDPKRAFKHAVVTSKGGE